MARHEHAHLFGHLARWPSQLRRQVNATSTAIPGGIIRVGSVPFQSDISFFAYLYILFS